MKAGVFVLVIAVAAVASSGQYSLSKIQKPDRYAFPPAEKYETRYERSSDAPKLITNNDFFCTECAREGRIAQKERNDMKNVLEVQKTYPFLLDGKKTHTHGTYRLLEERADHILRFLFDELPTKNPVYIEDGMFKLFVDLPSFNSKKDPNPRRQEELTRLRDVFPEIGKDPGKLTAHQRAHLYLIRAHRIMDEFVRMTGHKPFRRYMDDRGPFLGMKQKWELYVFAKQKDCGKLIKLLLGHNPKMDGCWHRTIKDDSMVAICWAKNARDVWVNNTFTHRMSHIVMAGFRGYWFDMPTWLELGFAHVMERRERTDYNTFVVHDGLIGRPYKASDWQRGVRQAVQKGKYTPFKQIYPIVKPGAVPFAERGIIWSQVSFLMQDLKKFGEFIQLIKSKTAAESMTVRQDRAFKRVYGWTPEEFEAEWKKWVMKTYRR